MRKFLKLSLILLLMMSLSGCVIATDFYGGKRPYNYGEAKWISGTPDAWFITNEQTYAFPEGEIIVNGETIAFTLWFDRGISVDFVNENNGIILTGTCQFYPDKLIITIEKRHDKIFKGKYRKITFIRYPIDTV